MSSIPYYDKNAQAFHDRTINANMSESHDLFLELMVPSGNILDVGCGVGRDAHYFEKHGYAVSAFDGSVEMVRLANQILKNPAKQMFFDEMDFTEEFDGAWAAASLIHVPNKELTDIIKHIHKALKPGGIFLASFKHGDGEFTHEERTFYYMTDSGIRPYLEGLFEVIKIWTTEDRTSKVAPSPDKKWLNVLVRKV